jgi:hypothetical protein
MDIDGAPLSAVQDIGQISDDDKQGLPMTLDSEGDEHRSFIVISSDDEEEQSLPVPVGNNDTQPSPIVISSDEEEHSPQCTCSAQLSPVVCE